MGRSVAPSPGAHPQHPVGVRRDLLNPHGWQSVTQGRSTASSGACSSNKRVNLTRRSADPDIRYRRARKLRAVR